MERWVENDGRVQEQEEELQALKRRQNITKKDLQIHRNRITAQLSRDRKKLEQDFLKMELVRARQKVRHLELMV